ncbi:hypothetical protein EJ377_04235 [Chryseobacterium arthrosphaerae]|uniref:Uncharacterized protein n=1 Tax=Chryseobacterium arthrosphaerae TaxID=651561 RepID=A0A432DZ80_9FLAO|nr:hypothetical protein EJ377_04235 [Chryseobacterium arthrosphaerae]
MYKVFSSLKEFSTGVTDQTKGKIRKRSFTSKMPLTIEMKPPNFCMGAEWQLERGQKNRKPLQTIGTSLELYFKAEPIIGLELTIDLLDMLIQAGVGVVSGGTANIAAKRILNEVRAWLADDDHPVTLNMYIDLKLFGTISGETKLNFNTNSDAEEQAENWIHRLVWNWMQNRGKSEICDHHCRSLRRRKIESYRKSYGYLWPSLGL